VEWKGTDGLRGPQNGGDHCSGVGVLSGLGALLG